MLKSIVCIAILLSFCIADGKAQKLPSIQKTGMHAPAKIKIDGKSPEWNHTFQAYNTNTNIYYTIANDDENLYLVVQSNNVGINSKILIGGLTFTINTSGDKKDKNGIAIMFPAVNQGSKLSAIRAAMASLNSANRRSSGDAETRKKQMDSVSYVLNRKQIDKLKEIRVTGIKEIKDTLLSIYNEEGIVPRALFETQDTYTYELAVPLKYLGMSSSSTKEFIYNITLNGVMSGFEPRQQMEIANMPDGRTMPGPGGMDLRVLALPTDFWGKYTLAK